MSDISKCALYLLIILFVIFISIITYTISNTYLPTTKNKILILLPSRSQNEELLAEYAMLCNMLEDATTTLININTQILNLQIQVNNKEEQKLQIRLAYLSKENSILQNIKNYITSINTLEYNKDTIINIVNNYGSLFDYVNINYNNLNDYFININNALLQDIEYNTNIENNYDIINLLTPFINDFYFGVYALEEINGLSYSIACRNQASLLLGFCQTNNIVSLNNIYIPLPNNNNVIGNDKLITYVKNNNDTILNIIPLTI